MMEKLNHKQKEALETLGFALAEDLGNFLYYESEGFGDFTITRFIDLILEVLNQYRKKEES